MRVIIAADFVPQNRVSQMVQKGDFSFFDNVTGVVSCADYSIVNLECPLVLSEAKPILKCGPSLKCNTEHVLDAILYAGFDGVTLANNHFRDYGDIGVDDTLRKCKEKGIDTVGGGKTLEEVGRILYKQLKGQTLAIINVCEEEFSIATDKHGGSNPLRPIENYYIIREARERADAVLVIVHGGIEHYQLPTPRMQETYRFFIDAGADAVVNHHQHCFSGYEVYNSKPIFYGLGNFCFDRPNFSMEWQQGYMVQLMFNERETSYDLYPYCQCTKNQVGVMMMEKKEKREFESKISELNAIIADPYKLQNEFAVYSVKKKKSRLVALEPIRNRYLNALQRRGILPSLVKDKYKLLVYHYLICEGHRDVYREILKQEYENID